MRLQVLARKRTTVLARLRVLLLVGGLVGVVLAVGGCAAAPSSTGSAARIGFTQTQTAQSYAVTLSVSPAKFGTNTFVVTVKTAGGEAVSGAEVKLATQMLDMDMGVQTAQLRPTRTPGMYSGQSDLNMSGRWEAMVDVAPPSAALLEPFDFRFSASY